MTQKHERPVDLSYRAIGRLRQPHYRLALLRADCLLREFVHGRVKMRTDLPDGSRRYYPVLAEDVPPVLLGFTSGVYTTPPAGIRIQGPDSDPDIRLMKYYVKHHRLAIETEDAVTRTTRLGVMDFDGGPGHGDPLCDPLGAARDTLAALRALGWPAYLVRSNSGAGYHLYVFFQHPISSADARRIMDHVLRIDDDERARVEINPLDRTGQHGSLIHLPWWAHSRADCNVFIDPESEAEIVLPDGGVFQRITPAQVADLLATLPPPPPSVESTAATTPVSAASAPPRTLRTTPTGDTSRERDTWRSRVQGDRQLIKAVYGPYLTGKQRNGWLECRDPASPTGDRHPSAGVCVHTGVFFSHRRDASLSIFDMMIELGQAQTIGEAFRRAEEITGILRPTVPNASSWRAADSYVMPTDAPGPTLPEGFPLEDAREKLREIVREEILPAVVHRQPTAVLIRAGTGVGKSRELAHMVADIAKGAIVGAGAPLRVAWLTDSKHNRDEMVKEYLTVTSSRRRVLIEGVAKAHARAPKEKDPGYCRQFALAQFLAGRRQPVKETICDRCQADALKAAKRAWERLPPEEQAKKAPDDLATPCPYLTQREQYQTARVLVGTQQSFQFGGELIEGFDLVVVDEKAVEMFFATCDITAADIAQWEDRQEKDPALWDVLKPVLSLLKQALITGKAEGVTIPAEGTPLIPLLRRLAPDLDELVERLWQRFPCDRWGIATKFDQADASTVWQRREAPLLILRTLVNLLAEECRRGTARDTQCWVLPAMGQEPAQIHLTLVREELLRSLQQCVVVFLDATAHTPTLQRLWHDQLRVYELPVQTQCYTTIFTDMHYHTQQIISDPDRDATLARVIHRLCAQATRPLIVCEKSLREHWRDRFPPHALVTYWGAADMAGSNRYRDCDLFIGIGHPRGADADLIRQTVAARVCTGNRDPLPDGYEHFAKAPIPTPYVGYRDTEGRAWVRKVRYPVDADACDRVLNSYAASFTQGVGRVRPANPRPHPLSIYLFTGEAPRDLRIDAMTTLEAWAVEDADAAYRAKRTAFQEAGARVNAQRAEATLDQLLATARRMLAENKRLSINGLHRECGGSKKTVQKYYPQVLQALKMTVPRPFCLPQSQDEQDYPLYGVYQRGFQRYPGAVEYWEETDLWAAQRMLAVARFGDVHAGRRVLLPQEVADYAAALPRLMEDEQLVQQELDRLEPLWHTVTLKAVAHLTEEEYWRMVDEEHTPEWLAEQAFGDWWRTLTLPEKTALVQEKCGVAA